MSNSENPNNNTPPQQKNKKKDESKKDPSNNDIINPFFSSLHGCNNIKNRKCTLDLSKNIVFDPSANMLFNQRYLNGRNNNFTMRFNSILEELRKNRRENTYKINNNHDKIANNLDKQNLSLVPVENRRKQDLHSFLRDITNKYNLLYDEKTKENENKIITEWGNNYRPRRNSVWFGSLDDSVKMPAPPHFPPIPQQRLPPPVLPIEKKKVTINREINGLTDILKLIEDYPLKDDIEYNIDMSILHNVSKPLQNLDSMIGMHKLKNSIVDQVIYFLQGLDKNNDFMHTVIYGPPGTGKTEVAKIMGAIFSSIGILNKNTFKKVTRADLIAGYLGQTAIKTKDVIKDSLGGVLFIDEAYALGNREKKDSFAKECIDTLCEALSDHKSNIMVIIAGYEEDLKKCFFAYNQGLDSRFPWRFHTDDYTATELKRIFIKKIKDINWSVDAPIPDSWFESKMDYFKYYGRDMETLLAKTKIAHGRRVFCKPKKEKTIITRKDIDKGFEMFISNNEVKERKDEGLAIPFMYL